MPEMEWAAVVLAPNKDGSLRLGVDNRKLNTATVRDSSPILDMDEGIINSLAAALIFSILHANGSN